jgi:putative ABC transport system permease protein
MDIQTFFHRFRLAPLRSVLTVLTILLGTATLIISSGLNLDIQGALQSNNSQEGRLIVIANGTLSSEDSIEFQEPGALDSKAAEILSYSYNALSDISLATNAWLGRFLNAEGTSYTFRSAIQVTENYASLMDLEIIEGSFFTAQDIQERKDLIVISEQAAEIMFGSAAEALGSSIRVQNKSSESPLTVLGIYKTLGNAERERYGVGDLILPMGNGVPRGIKLDPMMFNGVIMARLKDESLLSASGQIREILQNEYGKSTEISIWEGSPSGPDPLIEQESRSIENFGLTVNVLGIVILFISSLGMFSIMLVEVMNRTREIGLMRSMGSSKIDIVVHFLKNSLYFGILGVLGGVLTAFLIYNPLANYLIPLLDVASIRITEINFVLPNPIAVLIAAVLSLLFTSAFALYPAYNAASLSIVECIREEQ